MKEVPAANCCVESRVTSKIAELENVTKLGRSGSSQLPDAKVPVQSIFPLLLESVKLISLNAKPVSIPLKKSK